MTSESAGKNEELSLKWGTIKGWDNLGERSQSIMKRYFADGVPMSAMADKPSEDRRTILIELLDQFEGKIYLDWDGKYVSKEEAKKYVSEYR